MRTPESTPMLPHRDESWRRSCDVVGITRGVFAFCFLFPFFAVYFALAGIVFVLIGPVACCRSKVRRKGVFRWYFRPVVRILHLGPWGPNFDSTLAVGVVLFAVATTSAHDRVLRQHCCPACTHVFPGVRSLQPCGCRFGAAVVEEL